MRRLAGSSHFIPPADWIMAGFHLSFFVFDVLGRSITAVQPARQPFAFSIPH